MNLKFEISNLKWIIESDKRKLHSRFTIFQFPISIFRRLWWWLRHVSGDAAYDNYLSWAARRGPGPVCTREEFYVESLRRRYRGVSRCC